MAPLPMPLPAAITSRSSPAFSFARTTSMRQAVPKGMAMPAASSNGIHSGKTYASAASIRASSA